MSDSADHTSNGHYVKEIRAEEDSKLEFSEDEEALVARMFSLVGQRWSLIAGRIPGRSAEEIEKYWTSKCTIHQVKLNYLIYSTQSSESDTAG